MRRKGSPRAQRRLYIRVLGGAFAIAVHLILLAALLWWPQSAPKRPQIAEPPITVSLIEAPKPPGPSELQALARVTPVSPKAPNIAPPVFVVVAHSPPPPGTDDVLSPAQIAGAATAGEGGQGGGGCNVAQLVQRALRRDPLVMRAVKDAHRAGEAILLWNGDWVRSGEQEGKGLSAVREAIMWEVAFAPEACRNRPEHGLVLLSLTDGATRFAIGNTDWRWTDLLGLGGKPQTR